MSINKEQIIKASIASAICIGFCTFMWLLAHINDRQAFIFGCDSEGKMTRAECEKVADNLGYRKHFPWIRKSS